MRLLVIRHGETRANIENRYSGHADSPLTHVGLRRAEELAERVAIIGPEIIFRSDLPRVMATVAPLIRRTGLPVRIDTRLRELDFGRIEGLTYTEAMDLFKADMQDWYDELEHRAPPGGETLAGMRARVDAFLADLVEQPFETVALYTHGGVCNLLLAKATRKPFGTAWSLPGELCELQLTGTKDNWHLERVFDILP